MRNVVTGSSGFIGGHLVRALLDLGESVIAVDKRYSDELEEWGALHPGDLEIICDDLSDKGSWKGIVDGADRIFHLAAETDLGKSVRSPAASLSDDLLTTVNLLDACVKAGTSPRIVIASSAAIYGDLVSNPVSEDDSKEAIGLSPYAIHKRSCEMYADMYRVVHGLSVVCLRYFNVYGPGQENLQAVVPAFTLGILRGNAAVIRGDGLQSRDFIHVRDVVDATISMGDTKYVGQFNVGCGRSYTLLELILILEELSGERFEVNYQPASNWDIKHSCADISHLRRTGWVPKLGLKAGMVDTLAYYQGLI